MHRKHLVVALLSKSKISDILKVYLQDINDLVNIIFEYYNPYEYALNIYWNAPNKQLLSCI